jgi:hypothetical protein
MATYAEALNRLGDTVLETTKRVAEINVRAGERLLEQQAEMTTQWINAANRNVDIASKAMGMHDWFAGQAQIAQEYSQQMLSVWRRSGEIVSEASRQVAEAVEQAARTARQEGRRQTGAAGTA